MNLQDFGLKQTKTREKILEILQNTKDPMSAEEVYRMLLDENINLSTIYRTLTSFCERGLLVKDVRTDGKAVYSYKRKNHHHTLVCIKCNKKIYLDECPFKEVYQNIDKKYGFHVEDHNMELYGYCSDCINIK